MKKYDVYYRDVYGHQWFIILDNEDVLVQWNREVGLPWMFYITSSDELSKLNKIGNLLDSNFQVDWMREEILEKLKEL
jgi:hypothetical protein